MTPLARGARGLAFAAVVAVVLATRPAAVVAADAEVRTAHLLVRGDIPEAELARYGALAEACWGHWKAYFGAEPKQKDLPLLLDVRRDREGFESALRRAGVDRSAVGSAGGYYDPRSRTSYLFLQPHDSSTRLLVLHELTHQLHAKVVLDNDLTRSPLWHKEGIAEWFGFHRRGKGGLEVGVLDGVAIDDRPTQCAERLRTPGADPWAVLTGSAKTVDYTDALMLVAAFLRTKDATVSKAFRTLEREFESGGDPAKKTARAFAGERERVLAAVHETWDGFRRPWKGVYIAWDEEDGAIVGHGRPWAFLQGTSDLARGKVSIEAKVSLGGREAAAGAIAVGVKGPDDLVAAEVRADATVVVRRKVRGTWYDLGVVRLTVPPTRDPVAVRLEAVGPLLRLSVAGVVALDVDGIAAGLTSADLDGAAGLAAEGGPVRFHDVTTGR
jgi:hypothetical protein